MLLGGILSSISCVDEPVREARFEIQSEPFAGNGSKMAVSGRVAEWVDGDNIRINNTTATVSLSDGKAYLSGDVLEANVYRAVYPAGIASGALSEDEVTVTLPSTYTCSEQDGRQVIDLPMAAAAREFPLTFKHLTAGLLVEVENDISTSGQSWASSYYTDLYVDKIIVRSNKYNLCGRRTIDIANIGNIGSVVGTDTTVTLYFGLDAVSVEANGSKTFVIPVLPVGGDNKFTVEIDGHFNSHGTAKKYFRTSRTQSVGGTLARNNLAYAPTEMTISNLISEEEALANDIRESGDSVYIYSPTGFLQAFEKLNSDQSYRSKTYMLMNDISVGSAINPVAYFQGTFDGNGHTVSNLSINTSSAFAIGTSGSKNTRASGMFYFPLGNAVVKNLTLSNVALATDAQSYDNHLHVGAIFANAASSELYSMTTSSVTISNCHVSGVTVGAKAGSSPSTTCNCLFGGFVGYANANTTITDCSFSGSPTVSATGNLRVGGMVGFLTYYGNNNITLTTSGITTSGTITAVKYKNASQTLTAGGLLGYKSTSRTAYTASGNSYGITFMTRTSTGTATTFSVNECGN